ncbi:MAG: hypothetical protein KJ667_03290, partial [Alphaproteobacteria bacterium]|nr:hypothetical protein [Alphaproteobacteria bacterium]
MTDQKAHITCIGLANVDVIAAVDDEFLQSHNIAKGASTLLDACTTGTILGKLQKPAFAPGGVSANTACGLADAGLNVRFVGKTGDDIYGEIFRDGFKDRTIVTDSRPYAPKMTSTCLTLITPDKDRSFAFCTDTAGWYIFADDLPEGAPYVYMEANTVHMPPDSQGNLLSAAVDKYEAEGAKIIINLNDREIVTTGRATLTATLRRNVHFYVSNVQEFCTLFDVTTAAEAWALARATGRNFAVTDGMDGARILYEGQMTHVPAVDLDQNRVVNTLGAGDQFAAGFVAGLI